MVVINCTTEESVLELVICLNNNILHNMCALYFMGGGSGKTGAIKPTALSMTSPTESPYFINISSE